MGGRLARLVAIDLRALAAFRVGLGLLLLVDLVLRATELTDHLTELGCLPAGLAARAAGPWRWSFHGWLAHPAWPALLLVLAGLAAGALTLGLRPRLAAAASYLLLVSLQHRNYLVLDGADDLLRVMLFWALWVPLPARGDRLRGEHVSLAGACLLLQPILMYLFSALFKTGPEWWEDASAVGLALEYGQLARGAAGWLGGLSSLPPFLTHAVLVTELVAPFLLLVPRDAVRLAGIGLLTGLQLGLFACLAIPLFAATATVALLPFLPASVLDRMGWRSEAPADEPGSGGRGEPLLAVAFGYVMLVNLAGLPQLGLELPGAVAAPGQVLGLEQSWHMFSPAPPDKDGYYLRRGRARGGPWFDLATGRAPVAPADHRYAGLPSYRWWKRLEPFLREPWMLEPWLRAGMRAARDRGMAVDEAELVFMAFNLRVPRAKRRATERVFLGLAGP